jgi:para-nitrobenzyl esterase
VNTQPGPIVETVNGKLRGADLGGVVVFKGIAYGASTGGAGRFRPPISPAPWSGVCDALNFGAGCPQNAPTLGPNAQLFPDDLSVGSQDEDCLVLNVWTPAAGAGGRRPVMVWLHGGSFTMGSGSLSWYDGARLCRQGDVVIVTVNHRLNVFGFLDLSAIAGDGFAQSGNAGMLDLVLALSWIRDNIAAFGGDPDNVTIFGESGGGAKVCTLLAMPAAAGLFHRAIVQSGPFASANDPQDSATVARALLTELDISPERCADLQNIAPEVLLRAAAMAEAKIGRNPLDGSMGTWAPVIDGVCLPHHPFDPAAPAESNSVPVMIGTTKDELTLFLLDIPGFASMSEAQIAGFAAPILGARAKDALAFYKSAYPFEGPGDRLARLLTDLLARRPTTRIAERKAEAGAAPVYLYVLAWETPVLGGALRAPHSLDIPLVFDNVGAARGLVGDGPGAAAMARVMSATWLAFARTGAPDNPLIPPWPAYSLGRRAAMVFDVESRPVDDYAGETRRFWAAAEGDPGRGEHGE